MKAIFLIFACFAMIFLLKEVQKKEQVERIDIVKFHVLDFSGTMFLPKTIQADEQLVNSGFIVISVPSKKYQYVKCPNGYCLVGNVREVPVSVGDKVEVSFPTKLFFAKELK